MIPLLKSLWRDFWYSPEKARLWLRSVITFVTLTLIQVFSYPWEVVQTWSTKEIMFRMAVSGLGAFALGIGVGEKNKPPEPAAKP